MRYRYGTFLIQVLIGTSLFSNCAPRAGQSDKKETPVESGYAANIAVVEKIASNAEKDADWRSVYRAAEALRNLKDKRTEKTFLKILERKEPIRLRTGSDLPQVMAPLNMLKSIAVESLRDTGGAQYIETFRLIAKETDEPLLRKMVTQHIQALEKETGPR